MNFHQKIWEAKRTLPKMKKASKGFKFKYTNLEDIEKQVIAKCEELKIGYTHRTEVRNDRNVLITKIFDLESDVFENHELIVEEGVQLSGMNTYQVLGSALTYFRRYHLVVAFGIITGEDIDAIEPKAQKPKMDYVKKAQDLVGLGRKQATLDLFYEKYKDDMSPEQQSQVKQIISNNG